jgi:hypothetical protein
MAPQSQSRARFPVGLVTLSLGEHSMHCESPAGRSTAQLGVGALSSFLLNTMLASASLNHQQVTLLPNWSCRDKNDATRGPPPLKHTQNSIHPGPSEHRSLTPKGARSPVLFSKSPQDELLIHFPEKNKALRK